MDRIVPITELRANLSEITKWAERRRHPVLLTKNGRVRYVLLDIKSYEKLIGAVEDDDQSASAQPARRTRAESVAPAGFASDLINKPEPDEEPAPTPVRPQNSTPVSEMTVSERTAALFSEVKQKAEEAEAAYQVEEELTIETAPAEPAEEEAPLEEHIQEVMAEEETPAEEPALETVAEETAVTASPALDKGTPERPSYRSRYAPPLKVKAEDVFGESPEWLTPQKPAADQPEEPEQVAEEALVEEESSSAAAAELEALIVEDDTLSVQEPEPTEEPAAESTDLEQHTENTLSEELLEEEARILRELGLA